MIPLKKILAVLTPPETPYILRVGDIGNFVKQRAYFRYGVYWIEVTSKASGTNMYPLRKNTMSPTAFELVEANRHCHNGQLLDKSWCPLTKQMLAWYNMLPDGKTTPVSGAEANTCPDPQMPE